MRREYRPRGRSTTPPPDRAASVDVGGVRVPGGLRRLQSGWDGRSPSGGFDSRPPPPTRPRVRRLRRAGSQFIHAGRRSSRSRGASHVGRTSRSRRTIVSAAACDSWSWPERSSVDGRTQVKLPPRCPRRRAQRRRRQAAVFHSDLALHDEVDALRSLVRSVQESREDLGGEIERWVCDHAERCPRQAQSTEVGLDDPGTAGGIRIHHAVTQLLRPDGIVFHRPDLGACVEEWKSQGTRAGAEIDDEFTGAHVERTDEPFDDALINEEVLTEFATPRIALGGYPLGHGPSPSSSCRHRSNRSRSDRPTFRVMQRSDDGSHRMPTVVGRSVQVSRRRRPSRNCRSTAF